MLFQLSKLKQKAVSFEDGALNGLVKTFSRKRKRKGLALTISNINFLQLLLVLTCWVKFCCGYLSAAK